MPNYTLISFTFVPEVLPLLFGQVLDKNAMELRLYAGEKVDSYPRGTFILRRGKHYEKSLHLHRWLERISEAMRCVHNITVAKAE